MDKRLILSLLIFVFMLSLVNATAKIEQQYNVTVSCSGFTCANLNITVLHPNSTTLVSNQRMINHADYASYQILPAALGEYKYFLFDGGNYSSGTFFATATGYELTTPNAVVYSMIFAILIFLFVVNGIAMAKIPGSNNKGAENEIISINYLKYFKSALFIFAWGLVISILLISSSLANSYLGDSGVSTLLFNLFKILSSWQLVVLVLILWFFYIIWNVMRDIKIKGMLDRGFFPRGDI